MGGSRTVTIEREQYTLTASINGEAVLSKFPGRPITVLSDNVAMIADAATALYSTESDAS